MRINLRAGRLTAGLVASALVGLATIAGAQPSERSDRLPVRSLLELRNDGLVRQHWDLSCGAAAVATVLTFQLGNATTEREAALGMLQMTDAKLVRSRLGFSLLDLKKFAAARGFVATGYGNLELPELLAMSPAITPLRLGGFGHFVIVRGLKNDRLLIADPSFGNRAMPVREFLGAWTSRVGFTIKRGNDPNPPNRMAWSPELAIAPSGAAVRAADAAIRRVGGR